MGILQTELKYSYNDILVKPAVLSSICHRGECSPFVNGKLPIFTAPMDTVVSKDNFDLYDKNGIIPILPRTEKLDLRTTYAINGKWAAFSLGEFKDIFCNGGKMFDNRNIKVLIDIANGHMSCLYSAVSDAKGLYGDRLVLMVGNIANPETYRVAAEANIDYVRCGVGGGSGCLTSSNTAIHYPMASLINETYKIKRDMIDKHGFDELYLPKIVADGGIRNYSDIIKALALGADYVMCGSIFAKMLESAAPKTSNSEAFLRKGLDFSEYDHFEKTEGGWIGYLENGESVYAGDITLNFYGMASREGQIALSGKKTKTSEGMLKTFNAEYTMQGWVKNFSDYLKSAMSYCNCNTVEKFKENAVPIVISNNTYHSINK